MHAACGGEQGGGEAGDYLSPRQSSPDPGRGLRPLHSLTSAFMRDTQTPALPAGFYMLPAAS